jgi:hypothetical protein
MVLPLDILQHRQVLLVNRLVELLLERHVVGMNPRELLVLPRVVVRLHVLIPHRPNLHSTNRKKKRERKKLASEQTHTERERS